MREADWAESSRKAVFKDWKRQCYHDRRVRRNGWKGSQGTKEMSAITRNDGGGAWEESVVSVERCPEVKENEDI